jgi:hypothetical protein
MNPKWGWLAMVDRLSNGDITRHSDVYEQNYIYCLNILSYWKERDEYAEQINKQQMRQQTRRR